MEADMAQTQENPHERTIELANQITRLESMVIGSSKAPLPRLNAELAREPARIIPILQGSHHIQSSIEADFPHIAEKLSLVWGYPECFSYLTGLIIDNRGNRKGFDLDIMGDLMMLLKITEQVTPDQWAGAPGKYR